MIVEDLCASQEVSSHWSPLHMTVNTVLLSHRHLTGAVSNINKHHSHSGLCIPGELADLRANTPTRALLFLILWVYVLTSLDFLSIKNVRMWLL